MNKLAVFLLVSALTAGCTKVSEYVADIIPGFKKEEELGQKVVPNLCPQDKLTVQIVEGVCEGDWSTSYDSNSKIYTCSYKHKSTVTCPDGAVSIGQPSACGGQVDQHSKASVTTAKCDELYKDTVQVAYRLVCCT